MKQSKIMGRALSEKRWDKSSETVLDPKVTSEFVVTTRRNGDIVIPLFRVGCPLPKDSKVLVDILKAAKVI